jgi:hypothetical protein
MAVKLKSGNINKLTMRSIEKIEKRLSEIDKESDIPEN